MAIVRMKRLRLIAPRRERDALLGELMRLGCVQVTRQELSEEDAAQLSRESSELVRLRTERSRVLSAVQLLERYAPEKKKFLAPRPSVRQSEFFDEAALREDLALADRIGDMEAQLRRLENDRTQLREQIESLRPWRALDESFDAQTRTCAIALVSALAEIDALSVQRAAESVTDAAELYLVSDDGEQRYFAIVAFKEELEAVADALRAIGCTAVSFPGLTGTPQENLDRLSAALAAADEERERLIGQLRGEGKNASALRLSADRLGAEVARAEAVERLTGTESVVLLEGWCPEAAVGQLEKTAEAFGCAWETSDPAPEEYPDVPVTLKNSRLVRPMNLVTQMYSLPAYDGVDPNPLMWPFFVLFYGMMMADMGYGLVMMLLALVVIKKRRPWGPSERYLYPLMGLCGVSTFLWGAATGGFFGDMLPQLATLIDPGTSFTKMPALFSPLDDALMVLIGSLALGVVQILTGMGISAWKKLRRGDGLDALFEEGSWFVILAGAALAVTGVTPIALIIGGALLLVGSAYKAAREGGGPVKLVFGTLKGVGGSLYSNVTGYFSDILSYSRLMALMLAGAVIAQVFNTLGAITGNVATFFIISMIGNALNFALNLLGCFVHDMRLQCLEFFNRFYEDGGKPFQPLDMKAQYVDIVKD